MRTESCFGAQKCDIEGWDFSEIFRFQFRINRSGARLSSDWRLRHFFGWSVEFCPSLRISEVYGLDRELFAVVLGIAIDPDDECLRERTILTNSQNADRETWIEALAGRYVVLAKFGDEIRLYGDPSGNLSVVYDRQEQLIANSVTLAIPDGDGLPNASTLKAIAEKKHLLLFGKTTDPRVIRQTPNHYLRLSDFQEIRHWPKEGQEFGSLDENRSEIFREVPDRIARNIGALAKRFRCALPITGGMDSRIILASASHIFGDIGHYYCYGLNWSTEVDAKLASQIATHLALPFQVFPRRSPRVRGFWTEEDVNTEYAKMQLRTGWCYKMRGDWGRFVAMSPRVDVVLRGTAAEMTRANKWHQRDFGKSCSAEVGLAKLNGQTPDGQRSDQDEHDYKDLLGQYSAWMDKLPNAAHARLYDIAHMELWLPMGPVLEFSAFAKDFIVNPFNDRRLMQLTSGLAPRARKRSILVKKIIKRNCPELIDLPFHRVFARSIKGDVS